MQITHTNCNFPGKRCKSVKWLENSLLLSAIFKLRHKSSMFINLRTLSHSLRPYTCLDMLEYFTGESLWRRKSLFSCYLTLQHIIYVSDYSQAVSACVCVCVRDFYFSYCVSAPLSSRTWGAVYDEHAEAYANTDNNQLLPNSLPNSIEMCYLLLVMLMVIKNVTEKDEFENIFSC